MFFLLRKEERWNWTEECNKSFDQLKERLVSNPILRLPDLNRPFVLYTDASGYALGAILAQNDDNNCEFVCAYASRMLKGPEINYAITEKECLGVVWAIKHFHVYLSDTQFKVVTDHAALYWLMNLRDPQARLVRWSLYLQAYSFEIIHKRGRLHSNVDCLSRPVLAINTENIEETAEDNRGKYLDPWEDEILLVFLQKGKFPPGCSKKHIKRVSKRAENFKLEDDNYFQYNYKNKWVEWSKYEKRREIIEKAHSLGHFQAASTFKRLAEKYFWTKMMDDVVRVVKQCIVCHRHQKTLPKNHPAISSDIY